MQYDVFEAAKDAEGKRKAVTSSSEHYGPPRFALPAGRYYVAATYGKAISGMEIDVLAGDQPTRQTLDLRAGVLAVSAVLTAGGQPLKLGVQYDVFEAAKDAEGKHKAVTSSSEHYGPPRFALPAGRYYVAATYGKAISSMEIDVLAGDQPTLQTLDLRAGVLAVSAVLTAGGQPLKLGVQYDVFEAAKDAEGKRKPVTSSSEHYDPPHFPLPAGRYYVTAVSETGQAEAEIAVSAGQRQRVELPLRPKQKR